MHACIHATCSADFSEEGRNASTGAAMRLRRNVHLLFGCVTLKDLDPGVFITFSVS